LGNRVYLVLLALGLAQRLAALRAGLLAHSLGNMCHRLLARLLNNI
jgi:polysaccharide pyruvyl transferase WcaK-like protein